MERKLKVIHSSRERMFAPHPHALDAHGLLSLIILCIFQKSKNGLVTSFCVVFHRPTKPFCFAIL